VVLQDGQPHKAIGDTNRRLRQEQAVLREEKGAILPLDQDTPSEVLHNKQTLEEAMRQDMHGQRKRPKVLATAQAVV
jgi:hypothetical protein